jgi:hypothetical protein
VARETAALQHIQDELKSEEDAYLQLQTENQPLSEARVEKTFDFSAI